MEVGVFEARNRFSELIEAAERGEEVIVLKRGRAAVRIVAADDKAAVAQQRLRALDAARELGKQLVAERGCPFTHAELMEARDEGKR